MIMFGKLINGELYLAPKILNINGEKIIYPSDELLTSLGYKEVIYTTVPDMRDGFHVVEGWTESDDKLIQKWNYESDNDLLQPDEYLIEQIKSVSESEGYLKTKDADKKYIAKGINGTSLSVSTSGSFNNYSNNGLAFNVVRNLTGTSKYLSGSGYVLNATSLGIKDDGTTSFTHKKYDSFNKESGIYTNAKNTAALTFSGKSGLLYAKNTGSSDNITEDMYKRVGVIDSPDEEQKVYSAILIDNLINKIKNVLTELGASKEQLDLIII